MARGVPHLDDVVGETADARSSHRHVVPARPVGVVDAQGDRVALDLVGVGEDLVALGQSPRAEAAVADEADHRQAAGIDVGADLGPLDLAGAPRGSLGADRAHPPEREGRAQPVERQDLAPHERPEEGRAVGRWLRGGRDREAGFEALADEPGSCRRTARPTRHRCRSSADRAARSRTVGPGGKRLAKCSPWVLGRKPGTAFDSTIEQRVPTEASRPSNRYRTPSAAGSKRPLAGPRGASCLMSPVEVDDDSRR